MDLQMELLQSSKMAGMTQQVGTLCNNEVKPINHLNSSTHQVLCASSANPRKRKLSDIVPTRGSSKDTTVKTNSLPDMDELEGTLGNRELKPNVEGSLSAVQCPYASIEELSDSCLITFDDTSDLEAEEAEMYWLWHQDADERQLRRSIGAELDPEFALRNIRKRRALRAKSGCGSPSVNKQVPNRGLISDTADTFGTSKYETVSFHDSEGTRDKFKPNVEGSVSAVQCPCSVSAVQCPYASIEDLSDSCLITFDDTSDLEAEEAEMYWLWHQDEDERQLRRSIGAELDPEFALRNIRKRRALRGAKNGRGSPSVNKRVPNRGSLSGLSSLHS